LFKCETEGAAVVQSIYDPKGEGNVKNLYLSLKGRIKFVERYDAEIAKNMYQRLIDLDIPN
jgi:hypothetical protein